MRQALRDLKLDDKMYRPEAMRSAISKAKNELIRPEDYGLTAIGPRSCAGSTCATKRS